MALITRCNLCNKLKGGNSMLLACAKAGVKKESFTEVYSLGDYKQY